MARTARLRALTAAAVKAYFDDPARTSPLHDGGGLYLRKRHSSARWYLRMTDPASGAEQWHALFPDDAAAGYPHKGLAAARDEADRLRAIRSQGLDPRVERIRGIEERAAAREAAQAAARHRLTVRQLFERWATTELTPHTGPDGRRSGRKDGGTYTRQQFERRVFSAIGDRPAADVRRADLMEIMDGAKAQGRRRTANVLLADLKQMFAWGAKREIVDRNPLESVTKRDVGGAEPGRERVLSAEEVRGLSAALGQGTLSPRSSCAVWLILATGCRVSEAMGARWQDVDLVARKWYLPQTKNERDHTIHLSDFATRQLLQLQELDRERVRKALASKKARRAAEEAPAPADPRMRPSQWLFPNGDCTGHVCLKSFGKQLADRQRDADRRIQRRAKATESLALVGGRWTAHDLRRTAATMMAELGVSGDVIDECLNHVIESAVRRTYIRDRRLAEQAKAFDMLGARLATLVEGSKSEVAPATLRLVA